MNLHKLFEDQIAKSKKYVQLQSEGMSQMEATYKVFGAEVGDGMVRLKQAETMAFDKKLTEINKQ